MKYTVTFIDGQEQEVEASFYRLTGAWIEFLNKRFDRSIDHSVVCKVVTYSAHAVLSVEGAD